MKKPPELTEIAERTEAPAQTKPTPNVIDDAEEISAADERGSSVDFDYAEVSRLLGESEAPVMDEDDEARHQCAAALRKLFDWLLPEKNPRRLGLRLLAVAWVMDPHRFGNRSLRQLAKDEGINLGEFSTLTAMFSKRFGLRNHNQAHDWRPHTRE